MALKLKCPHPFQFPTGEMDGLCLFEMVISNDGYFASHLITTIVDDHLSVRLYHSPCFSPKMTVFMYVFYQDCGSTTDHIMNDCAFPDDLSLQSLEGIIIIYLIQKPISDYFI